ncbi:MAG: acetate kinase [Sphingomonas sp.]
MGRMMERRGPDIILALNVGSSSLKFGLYEAGATEIAELFADALEDPGQDERLFDRIEAALAAAQTPVPTAIAHRIVHGGPTLRRHCLIDPMVTEALQSAVAFAPLHGPASLKLIRQAQAHFSGLPQVACFDTVFHATLPEIAHTLPLPAALGAEGVRRYGFHGLSCASIVRELGSDLPDRLIIAHLGSGASVTAVKAGTSIDTSMGLTPTGGIIMSTRSGDLDPGVLLYLLREKQLGAAELETLLDHESGLLGISGVSEDLRQLHASSDRGARLAIDMFCYSVRKTIAAMAAALEGIDMLVFTGGIGENDAAVRAAICNRLRWVGDFAVRVIPSREDEQIAWQARNILQCLRA